MQETGAVCWHLLYLSLVPKDQYRIRPILPKISAPRSLKTKKSRVGEGTSGCNIKPLKNFNAMLEEK